MGLLSSLNGIAKKLAAMAARVLGLGRPESPPIGGPGTSDGGATLEWLRERFAEDVRRNFAEAHDPDGNPWAPLRWRIGRPLILTGLLMNSAYLAAQTVQLRNGTEIMATLAQPPYWKFHEYGTRRIPARPFFGPSADTVQELADRVAQDIADRIAGDS